MQPNQPPVNNNESWDVQRPQVVITPAVNSKGVPIVIPNVIPKVVVPIVADKNIVQTVKKKS